MRAAKLIIRFLSTYGMLAVLLLLCLYFSWATYHVESPTGSAAAEDLAAVLEGTTGRGAGVVIVGQTDPTSEAFVRSLASRLAARGRPAQAVLQGDPPAVRRALESLAAQGARVDVIATTQQVREWTIFSSLRQRVPALARTQIVAPSGRGRSTFLSPSNLRNVADQIAVIAIIAIGMTMVIITGGIDLSVGSLLALSAVVAAWLIRGLGGGSAGPGALLGASIGAVVACGAVGAFSGFVITRFSIPPFIATLAMMQVASGLAFILAQGQSIYDIPPSYTWLGRGSDLLSVPNAVVLMAALYLLAHLLMARTTLGRYIYAVGGNQESARLSGLSTRRILVLVYVISGVMAGIGGVITASQLKAGAPTYGLMYELYVIAAVVVGGTSLSGGEGQVFGTLIGAFIIAVIRNGMNLMNVEPYTQKVVLGLVILGAVLLDMLKQGRWRLWRPVKGHS